MCIHLPTFTCIHVLAVGMSARDSTNRQSGAGIGFVLAALSVVVAGIIEIARKDRMEEAGGTIVQELGGEKFNASTMSVFVQVPAYALVGASEVFASICGTLVGGNVMCEPVWPSGKALDW